MTNKKIFLSIAGITLLGTSSIAFTMDKSTLSKSKNYELLEKDFENIQKIIDPKPEQNLTEQERLESAIKNDSLENIATIILDPKNKNTKFDQTNAIKLALSGKKSKVIDCLFLSGFNFKLNISGKAPLEIACENKDLESTKAILKYPVEISDYAINLAKNTPEIPEILILLSHKLEEQLIEKKNELEKLNLEKFNFKKNIINMNEKLEN